ncbi:hypothetical protein L3X38_023560 [Prunus dulcis]|uniref:Uncharacterized protein n=1 Tax=Prunus dulcis TaxID=3755 RepID=A0AAD4Z5N9_PRUDU|nr:hypothetical protein L3X38_023560 [Prunus dulcis]
MPRRWFGDSTMSSNLNSSFALCRSLPLPLSPNLFYKQKRKQSVSSIRAGPAKDQSQIAKPENIARPAANFHPSVWGDRFINYDYSNDNITHVHDKQVDELKEMVRREVFISLNAGGDDGFAHQLKLIDAIQRLGVAYHFEREFEEALERIHGAYHDHAINDDDDGDLYNVALGFRLLRQHGYNVSCDLFNKFKDANGNFIIVDVSAQITQALERPLLKSLERLGARNYMSIYQDEASHNDALIELAKLDFNLVQSLHKKELSEIIRWWKEVDFERKLPFARNWVVESYFCTTAVYFEPQYSAARKILSKAIVLFIAMDDIYDEFGTFEELEILTEAIRRWDVNCMDELPDYMQIFFHILLNLFNEIEEEMVKEGNSCRVHYAKEAWKATARAFFDEARWLHEGCIPSMEEYMHVATTSVGNTLLSTISLLGMGDVVTKEAFEWLFSNSKILRASNIIFRLMNDIAVCKSEKERGLEASSVDCYMKQHGVSEQETLDVFNKQVVDLWKDINEELLIKPTIVPRPVLMRVLNLTRVMDLLYKRGDGFTHVGKLMKDIVTSLFLDPVPL